jgi:hypothetical protein
MTDTTAARRALLALLLDRVERGALLPAEAPLIRPLVLAEQGNADRAADYDNRLTWETTCGEHARLLDGCRAADERAEQAEAAVGRVRELAERWLYVPGLKDSPRTTLLRALDGPSPTPDATPTTDDDEDEDDGPVQCWHIEPGTPCDWNRCNQPERLARGDYGTDPAHGGAPTPRLDALRAGQPITLVDAVTDWATSVDEQCPARYIGDPILSPGVNYRCDRRGHGLDSDHAKQQGAGVVFRWADSIAIYPTDDAPSEPQCRDAEGCHSVIPCDPGCAGRESRLNAAFTPPRDAASEPQP